MYHKLGVRQSYPRYTDWAVPECQDCMYAVTGKEMYSVCGREHDTTIQRLANTVCEVCEAFADVSIQCYTIFNAAVLRQ